MSREELTQGRSEELAIVVALHTLNHDVKLCENIREEASDGVVCVGFVTQWERPGVV